MVYVITSIDSRGGTGPAAALLRTHSHAKKLIFGHMIVYMVQLYGISSMSLFTCTVVATMGPMQGGHDHAPLPNLHLSPHL